MAEDRDDSQRTEEPTQKRVDDARGRGQVVNSREINHWFMILAATLAVMMFAPRSLGAIAGLLLPFIETPDLIAADAGNLRALFFRLFGQLLLACLLPLGLLIAAALAGGFVQHGFLVSADSILPKLERLSPLAGARRLFSLRSIAEFVKGLAKLAIVGTVAAMLLWPALSDLANLATLDVADLLGHIRALSVRLLIGVLSIMTLIAGLDFLYQKFELLKQLRMTKQELKEEFKQSEGDPMVKGRLRQIRMERARRRMMAAVPQADVVVTNPTHFAVALKYESASMAAPRVVAKGADNVAQRIRAVAQENEVPLVENPPLARSLYAAVEIDQEIPPEHYKAVAEVIGYIMRMKRRTPPRVAP